MAPNDTEYARQLGEITGRLREIANGLDDLKAQVDGLSKDHAALSSRTALLMSILGGVAALVGSHVLGLVTGWT